jgi:hypothetical protein
MLRLGWSPGRGLDRADALDDARSEAFSSINGEAGGDDFWIWLPCLMVLLRAHGLDPWLVNAKDVTRPTRTDG